MESFLKYLEGLGEERGFYLALNPDGLDLTAASSDEPTQVVIIRTESVEDEGVNITVEQGARLNILEVVCGAGKSGVVISQVDSSMVNSTLVQLSSSEISYTVNLDGKGAEAEVNILQLPTAEDQIRADLRIAHNVACCTSRSASKCVAGGMSRGEFHGLVYVAPDAQQTISEQSSRNVALSREAKIIAEPQLEIYADDVKCTHGATVGQMNKDAILYMRQRGLSEEQARRVQLDGFVADVISACAIESLREPLVELVTERLHRI